MSMSVSEIDGAPLVCSLPIWTSLMERNWWPLLSKKTIMVDGSMHCGQALRSRTLERKLVLLVKMLPCGSRWLGDAEL